MYGELLVVNAGPIETKLYEQALNTATLTRDSSAFTSRLLARPIDLESHLARAMLRFQPKDVTLAYAACGGDRRGPKTIEDELASVATLWRLWLLRRATVTSTSRAAGHRRLPTLNTAPANDLTAPR